MVVVSGPSEFGDWCSWQAGSYTPGAWETEALSLSVVVFQRTAPRSFRKTFPIVEDACTS